MTDIAKVADQGTGFTLTESQMKNIGTVIGAVQGEADTAQILRDALPLLGDIKTLVPEVQKVIKAAKPVIDASEDKEGWIALFDKYGSQLEGVKQIPGLKLVASPLTELIDEILELRPQGEVTDAGKDSLEVFLKGVHDSQTGIHVSYFDSSEGSNSPADEARAWILEGVDRALRGEETSLSIDEVTMSVDGQLTPDETDSENNTPPSKSSPGVQPPTGDQHSSISFDTTPDKGIPPEGSDVETAPREGEASPNSARERISVPSSVEETPVKPQDKSGHQQGMLASTGANVLFIVGVGLIIVIAGVLIVGANRRKK